MVSRTKVQIAAAIGIAAGGGAGSSSALAAFFAADVVDAQTSGLVSPFTDAGSATGAPYGLTGEGTGFQTILSPFNPAYETQHITKIGGGGRLTLVLERYVLPGAGLELGVVSNNFLVDTDYPNGQNDNPAGIYGSDTPGGGTAEVRVSEDGTAWQSLGTVVFDMPANFYADAASPQQSNPGNTPADFGVPFDHTLSDFDGLNWQQTRDLFGNAGGGKWLDLSPSGLARVGYVQFIVPDGEQLVVDAVAISNTAAGDQVPEPVTATAFVVLGLLGATRRRAVR